jgi:hypothetical protein
MSSSTSPGRISGNSLQEHSNGCYGTFSKSDSVPTATTSRQYHPASHSVEARTRNPTQSCKGQKKRAEFSFWKPLADRHQECTIATMARLNDLDDWIDVYLRYLKEAYYETDPNKGEDGEIAKHELAGLAIEKFWYLHGKLLSWAQAHMTGYSILSENPKLVSFLETKLGYEITEDSHILEQIGLVYNYNPPDREDKALNDAGALLEEFNAQNPGDEELILTPNALRRLISELLMSRCADNSYWRHDLQHSMGALNEGEVDELAQPSPGRHQGLPASLNRWKLEALRQVRFRIGQGYKKYRALEEVGKAIGQSPEALRPWEKELERSRDRSVDLYCSELAGRYDQHFQGIENVEIPEAETDIRHRGLSNFEHAKYLHKVITDRQLPEIRDRIRHYRSVKSAR